MKTLFTLLSFAIVTPLALAQQNDTIRSATSYGGFAQAGINLHSADFRALPDVPNCCPQFTRGEGRAIAFGGLVGFPVNRSFRMQVRASYMMQDALMSVEEPTVIGVNGVATDGLFVHEIDATLSSFGIDPLFVYPLTPQLELYGGMRLGAMVTKRFHQEERLTKPADVGTFPNGSRTRNEYEGDIPRATTVTAALLAGAGYRLPLNALGSLFLVPEVFFQYGITPIVSGYTWSAHAIRAGVSIVYSPVNVIVPPPPPPPPKPKPVLAASVKAFGIEADGTTRDVATIRSEEFISSQLVPLLTYIFFDKNSSQIPSRYHHLSRDEAASYQLPTSLKTKTFDVYHNALNIIGRRMKLHPKSVVTITGCNNNDAEEKNNRALSRQRADAVATYLTTVWGIEPNRLRTSARNLPQQPTSATEEGGTEENQRVEISSDTWELIEPIALLDTVRVVDPTRVRFVPDVQADAGVANWKLEAKQNNALLTMFQGTSKPEASDWSIDPATIDVKSGSRKVEYTLMVRDAEGQVVTTPVQEIAVDHLTIQKKRTERIADKEIDRYNLILFDFDQTALSPSNQRIATIVKQRLNPNSTITVTGYTDRIGDAEYNRKLSESRALSTLTSLGITTATTRGVGEEELLYDNSLPEGRFYSRTVSIYVETPIK